MPTVRSDLTSIPRYIPGTRAEEVIPDVGGAPIAKLGSNEWPYSPFPEVVDAIAAAAADVNRYPDNLAYELRQALAAFHGVPAKSVWVGSGSSDIIRATALSVGGAANSAVFADPSFVLYPITTMISGAEPIAVPLTADYRHDLDRMLAAIRDDTTLVYVCNPNNPTGGHLSGDEVRAFLDHVPESVVVIVDEAYAEFVNASDYESMVQTAPDRSNVLTLRTFSKVYGLAGLRIGFGVGNEDLIADLRRTQAPFSATAVAQAGAIEALKHQDRVKERVSANAEGRDFLFAALVERGVAPAESQANYVYFVPARPSREIADALMAKGVIVRRLGVGLRVTVGTPSENARFVEALDEVLAAS